MYTSVIRCRSIYSSSIGSIAKIKVQANDLYFRFTSVKQCGPVDISLYLILEPWYACDFAASIPCFTDDMINSGFFIAGRAYNDPITRTNSNYLNSVCLIHINGSVEINGWLESKYMLYVPY